MACPFFVPVERLDDDRWLHAPRLPLGDAYRGICHAGPEPYEPPESSQQELCNRGYARGRCDRFPAAGPDAVRFSVIADDDSRLRIIYVFERGHAPEDHGIIEYLKSESRMERHANARLLDQAKAFAESYLRANAQQPLISLREIQRPLL